MGILGKISDALEKFERFREENFERAARRSYRNYDSNSTYSSSSSSSYTPNILSDITIPKIDIPKIELPKTTPLFDYTSFLTKKEEEKPVSIQPIDLSFLTKKEEKKPFFDYTSIFTKKEESKPSFPSFDYSSFLGDLRKQQEERRKQEEEERRREEGARRRARDEHNFSMISRAQFYEREAQFALHPLLAEDFRMRARMCRSLLY